MTSPGQPISEPPPRWSTLADWGLALGLAGTLVWTTMVLGGYLAETMVVTSRAVFGLSLLGAVVWIARGQGKPGLHLAVLLPVPFLLYALGSVYWQAPAKWLAWREWLLWFQMWLVFALTLHFGRNRGASKVLVGTLVLLGLVGTGMAAYQRFGNPSWMMLGRTQASQFTGRSAGMFGIPNSLAGLMEVMIPVCLVILPSRRVSMGGKFLGAALASLFIFALVLTGSRGGWIGLGLAMLVWPMMAVRDWKRKVLGAGAVLLVVGTGIGGLYRFSPYAHDRMQPFLEGKFEFSRPFLWRAGWRMWQDNPWWGQGAASYQVLFEGYREKGFFDSPLWTHNDYLNTLGDYGLVGFGLWLGAGLVLLAAGWAAVRRARREHAASIGLLWSARWKMGLCLGLLAFSAHLMVDFHTKIPALAFLAAMLAALLVRDEPAWHRPINSALVAVVGCLLVATGVVLAWRVSEPLYRAEAIRFEARLSIDRYAVTGEGDLGLIATQARSALTRAVRIYPENGQAWADLAYATVQSWHAGRGDLVALGRFAELAADEALARCPVNADFWIQKAIALEVQRGRPEAETCFLRAIELAPRSRSHWHDYARYLQAMPSRKLDARRALDTCLALDPHYPAANTLRQQLATPP